MRKGSIVAVDLGGTNIRLGLVTAGGKVVHRRRVSMIQHRSGEEIYEMLTGVISSFIDSSCGKAKPAAVSIGFAGYTHSATGRVYFAPNVGRLHNLYVGPTLRRRLRLPVFIANDANCAALGEYWRGAGRGSKSMFLFTVGTGIGGCFIIDGTIWEGAAGTAGEIGHTVVKMGGPRCNCGNRGCLEALASATAIIRAYRRATRGTASSEPVTAKSIVDLAKAGDETAAGVIRRAAEALGVGIANVFNLLGPETILVGGGVSRAGRLLIGPAVEAATGLIYEPLRQALKVKRTVLGDNAGLVGAARHALGRLGKLPD